MGRPTRLNAVIDHDTAGNPITVRDRVLTWLRTGLPFETTVLRAGVSPGTAEHWMKEASRVSERLLMNPDAAVTEHEAELVEFNHDLEVARAEGEARTFILLRQLADGGLTHTIITERCVIEPHPTKPGEYVERVIGRDKRIVTTLPSERAVMWLLERRYPSHYAKHVVVDTGTARDPLDEQERAELTVLALEDMLRTMTPPSTDDAQRP